MPSACLPAELFTMYPPRGNFTTSSLTSSPSSPFLHHSPSHSSSPAMTSTFTSPRNTGAFLRPAVPSSSTSCGTGVEFQLPLSAGCNTGGIGFQLNPFCFPAAAAAAAAMHCRSFQTSPRCSDLPHAAGMSAAAASLGQGLGRCGFDGLSRNDSIESLRERARQYAAPTGHAVDFSDTS